MGCHSAALSRCLVRGYNTAVASIAEVRPAWNTTAVAQPPYVLCIGKADGQGEIASGETGELV